MRASKPWGVSVRARILSAFFVVGLFRFPKERALRRSVQQVINFYRAAGGKTEVHARHHHHDREKCTVSYTARQQAGAAAAAVAHVLNSYLRIICMMCMNMIKYERVGHLLIGRRISRRRLRHPRAPSPCGVFSTCLLYTSPSPRDRQKSRMPSSA